MKQFLPLDYPTLIRKYLHDRWDRKEVCEEDIDVISFKNVAYDINTIVDDSVVKITNIASGAVYNVTVWDSMLDYANMSELHDLLSYIEQQVVYTKIDWINYYLKHGPIYKGVLFNLYRDGEVTYVEIVNSLSLCIFNETVSISGGLLFTPDIIHDGNTHEIHVESIVYNDDNRELSKLIIDDLLTSVFNSENIMNALNYETTDVTNKVPLNNAVYVNDRAVELCGIKISMSDDAIKFNHNKFNYIINKDGSFNKTEISEAKTIKENTKNMMYTTLFMKCNYTSKEEQAFINGLNATLNKIYMD